MKYDAVIFDLFGTLVPSFDDSLFGDCLAGMAAELGMREEMFRHAWLRETNVRRHTGAFDSLREEILHICELHDAEATDARVDAALQIRHDFTRRTLQPRPDAVSTLGALRGMGLRTALISDCSGDVPELWPETVFPGLFDATLFSCAVKLKKPDPRIYHLACAHLGVEPDGCLYVGDGCSNELTGAKAVGMRPFLLRPHDEDASSAFDQSEGDTWQGEVLSALSEVIRVVHGHEHPHV
jgi:putative hydrolase of the HAD superfamily